MSTVGAEAPPEVSCTGRAAVMVTPLAKVKVTCTVCEVNSCLFKC